MLAPYRFATNKAEYPRGVTPPERLHRPWSLWRWRLHRTQRVLAAFGWAALGVVLGKALAWSGEACLAAAVLMLGGYWLIRRRESRVLGARWNAVHERASAALRDGDLAGAAETYERLAAAADREGFPVDHALYVFHLALVHLAQGQLASAEALFISVFDSKWLAKRFVVADQIALSAAFCGRLDDAAAWQQRAHALASKRIQLLLVDALIDARGNRYSECADRLESSWVLAENAFTVHDMKLLRILRAFAMERAGAPREGVLRMLDGARPVPMYKLTAWRERWPEFDAFVSARLLDRAA